MFEKTKVASGCKDKGIRKFEFNGLNYSPSRHSELTKDKISLNCFIIARSLSKAFFSLQ